MSDTYEVFAVKYAHHGPRTAAMNFIGGDPHQGSHDLDFYVWAVVGKERTVIVDTVAYKDIGGEHRHVDDPERCAPLGPRQRSAIVASPAFFERHRKPVVPQELRELPCVLLRFSDGRLYHWEFERGGVEVIGKASRHIAHGAGVRAVKLRALGRRCIGVPLREGLDGRPLAVRGGTGQHHSLLDGREGGSLPIGVGRTVVV